MARPVKLNLIVDKSCNRVIFAESDEHFVDILLSFLTLPLGSILRLTQQSIGSMNNLLQSVQSLNIDCFSTEACRSMLLCPLNSASNLISSLPINYDNINNLFPFHYICSSCSYPHLSFYANARCTCGGLMNKKLKFVPNDTSSDYSSVFCNTAFKFTISDDLLVSQSSVEFSIEQLSKLDAKQRNSLESVSVDVTDDNILELLKQLLVSHTPLTDVFLGLHKLKDKVQVIQQPLPAPSASTGKISMKLYVNKEEDTVLIAEADNDFVDLLVGFLTYPMGAVISKLGGQSGIPCMDNLYNSVEALKPANCFRNNELIGKLLNPKLPKYFRAKNQLIKIDEEYQTQSYFTCSFRRCDNSSNVGNIPFTCEHYSGEKIGQLYLQLNLRDPKCDPNVEHSGGYMKFSRYMVTDDLFIRQPSSFMVITDILREAAGKGIHARNVEIGEQEALALLRASITSGIVLTDVLLGGFFSPISVPRSKTGIFGSLPRGGMKGGDQKLKKVRGVGNPSWITQDQIGVRHSRTEKFPVLLGVERGNCHFSRPLIFHMLFAAAALGCIVLVIFYWKQNVLTNSQFSFFS